MEHTITQLLTDPTLTEQRDKQIYATLTQAGLTQEEKIVFMDSKVNGNILLNSAMTKVQPYIQKL